MTKTRTSFYGSEGQRPPLGYSGDEIVDEVDVETVLDIDFPDDLDEGVRDSIEASIRSELESSEDGSLSEERLSEIIREHAGDGAEVEIESETTDEALGAGEDSTAGADEGSDDDVVEFVDGDWTVQGLDDYVETYEGDLDLSDYPHSGKKGDKLAFLNAAHTKEQ